jgi:signal transduction histidine kinase/CheY-like chemotaxis protein
MEHKNVRVLLIEDDDDDAFFVRQFLTSQPEDVFIFTLDWAQTLDHGVRLLSEKRFDVVLLDLMLPESRGLDTLIQVRSQAPSVPIVVLTGLQDEATGVRAVGSGAQDYLVKGHMDAALLKRAIRYAMERNALLAQMEAIIEKAADGMVVVDSAGLICYMNPAAETLLGCRAADMHARPFGFPAAPGKTTEIRIPQAAGVEKFAEMRVREIPWRDQSATLLMLRDITELRRMEKLRAEIRERQRMDRLKDEFMSAVSHELRTPLTIVKAAICNLKEGLVGPVTPAQENLVNLADRGSERLLRLINNILDLSRLESGMAKMNRRRVNLGPLLQEVASGFSVMVGDQKLALRLTIPAEVPPVYADGDMLVQVFGNLLDNALRFAKSRVTLKVAALEKAFTGGERDRGSASDRESPGISATREVQISVIDDGPGIPAESLTEIFDKFLQINRPHGGKGYKGTGLGLAICKQIVDRHEGRIWAESAPGQGAQFHVTLPAYGE